MAGSGSGSHDQIFEGTYNSKEVSGANQHFYELKQCNKNNWIQKNGSCEPTFPKPGKLKAATDLKITKVEVLIHSPGRKG